MVLLRCPNDPRTWHLKSGPILPPSDAQHLSKNDFIEAGHYMLFGYGNTGSSVT